MAGTPDPGHGGQDLAHEGGPPARVTGLGGDIGPLSVQGDELPGQVGQHHCGGVGAGDHHGLVLQARDDLAGPGCVASAPVLLEPGVNPCLARSLQIGWSGPGGDGPPRRRRVPARAPLRPRGLGGVLGVQAPDPVCGLVDLAGQVQVEASQHAQRRGVLVRGADGSQGVGHGPCGLGDDGGVLGVGLGAARCQVGDASHRQSGQVAHGGAHVLGHCHGQGPDGGGLVYYHQQVSVIGQLLVEHAGAPLRRAGPCRRPSARPGSGQWPSARSLPKPGTDEDLDVLDIHLRAASRCMGVGPAGGRQVPHPRLRKTSTVLRWVVPLISGHQRPAAAGDFRPRII